MRITILGSGTSQGVPIIGCECPTCTSDDPKDKRLRVSAHIVTDSGLNVLIDTSPDFRQQMLVNGLTDVDVILYTHHHIDHIMGLDDIRQINQLHHKTVNVYGNEDTLNYIRRSFSYIFDPNTYKGGGIPDIDLHVITLEPFKINDETVIPIWYWHGPTIVWGYRIGKFAYMTDCSSIPESEYEKLNDLDVLILDALRYRPHPTHYSINEATGAALRISAKRTYFTHITHDVLHEAANMELPENIRIAHDGLIIEI